MAVRQYPRILTLSKGSLFLYGSSGMWKTITTIYRKMRAGAFPHPVRIGRRRVAWRNTQNIMQWQQHLEVGTETRQSTDRSHDGNQRPGPKHRPPPGMTPPRKFAGYILRDVNTEAFLAKADTYFTDAYKQFCAFGGPYVYFHQECLRARERELLSDRHIEMLYATLTAWGMHRMGDAERTKTKLMEWAEFRDSILASGERLAPFLKLTDLSEREYAAAVAAWLWPCIVRCG